MQESINRSRQAQIDRKRQQREAELAEQQRFSSEWSTIQKQLEQEERDAKEERRQRELALQADILRQAAARNAELRQARERHRTDEVAAAAQAKLAEADFFKTADRCVPVCVCVCVGGCVCVGVRVCVRVCVFSPGRAAAYRRSQPNGCVVCRFVEAEIAKGHNPVPAVRAMERTKAERLIPANAVF